MPFADINGFRMHYQIDGPWGASPVLLSNSLGTNLGMWFPQIEIWSQGHCVIRYDTRGHVLSETPIPPYSMEAMGRDALALLDFLNVETVDFCGLSMGGMIGMWIAIHFPNRVKNLVLANTAVSIGSPGIWNARIEAVSKGGMEAVIAQVRSRWFTSAFCDDRKQEVAAAEAMLRAVDPNGYSNCCAAIRDADLDCGLMAIRARTLVISGEQDPVIPKEDSEALVTAISGSRHVRLPAAHLSNIEAARSFTDRVLDFIG